MTLTKQAKEKILKEFDTEFYYLMKPLSKDSNQGMVTCGEEVKVFLSHALDQIEEQTRRETIEIIKGFGYTDLQILDEIDNEQGDGMADFMRGYNEAVNKILAKLKVKKSSLREKI